jgi:hypothetical protein
LIRADLLPEPPPLIFTIARRRFTEQLLTGAVNVTIAEGEKRVQDLRLAQ